MTTGEPVPTQSQGPSQPPPPPPPASAQPASASGKKGRVKSRTKKSSSSTQGTSSTQLPPSFAAVILPDNAPAWLRDAVPWLAKTDLGPQYAALLSALVRTEVAFGFDPDTYGALPSDNRPSQVGDWINRARSRMKTTPAIPSLTKYAEQWAAWWDAMQPKWRRRGTDGKWRSGGDEKYGGSEEWGMLDRPGPNGCLSVVASLYFWGVCENQSAAMKAQWREAVEDVSWILEELEGSMKEGK
ncbi:hypothetical protein C8R47DRAFT_960291 [Mycena vitilis]|nr:hypothetical protein C8R47DRAFT_960291 [Mycena vitilis]